ESEAAQTAAHDVAVHIAAMSPTYLNRDEVPEDIVTDERRIAEETARAEGKPERAMQNIIEGRVTGYLRNVVLLDQPVAKDIQNIIEGRLTGYFKDVVLLDQPFAKDTKNTVGGVLEEAGTKAVSFARFRVGA